MRQFQKCGRNSEPDEAFVQMTIQELWEKEQEFDQDFEDAFDEDFEEYDDEEQEDPDDYHNRMRNFGYSQGDDGEWEHDDEFQESDY